MIRWLVSAYFFACWAQTPQSDAVAQFIEQGMFDPQQISETELARQIETLYQHENEPERRDLLAHRLLTVKWLRLWEADSELPAETVLAGDPTRQHACPSENWQWRDVPRSSLNLSGFPFISTSDQPTIRVHFSQPAEGTASHHLRGTFPYILPVNGTLLQWVYFPEPQIPDAITLRIETGTLAGQPHQQTTTLVEARWTKQPEAHLVTENRPSRFWAGTIPALPDGQSGQWRLLTVDLLDLGLCGEYRSIRSIEFRAAGAPVWFGPTVVRRPQVEIRGTQAYNVFTSPDPLQFEIRVHNFAATVERYALHLRVTDYAGSEVLETTYPLEIQGKTTVRQPLTFPPGKKRYWVFEYTLHNGAEQVAHGYSAATLMTPNITGRQDNSPFGMMYWEQPGQAMVNLYEQLGVKRLVIFPELHRLHLFDPQKFAVVPMIWSLPEPNSPEAQKLQQDIQPYLAAGQRIFSNFWETDLRVPAELFAAKMKQFYAIIKQVEPAALVGIGGLSDFNVAYVQRLFQTIQQGEQPVKLFDFLAAMSYTTPGPPELAGLEQEAGALRRLFTTYKQPDLKLWNVEWAYFDNLNVDGDLWLNTGVSQPLIAPYFIRHHLLGFAAGIRRMIPGTIVYTGRTPLIKNYGHSMALGRSSVFRYDLTPLPILPAYSVMTRMLEGKTFVAELSRSPNLHCQVYQAVDANYQALQSRPVVLALWTVVGNEQVTLPLRSQEQGETTVTLLNMVGDETTQMTYCGALQIDVSPEPTYILLDENIELQTPVITTLNTDRLLSVSHRTIELAPGSPAAFRLTYRVANPGWKAMPATLRLIQPNWLTVVNREIRYPDPVQAQLAAAMLPEQTAVPGADDLWLGRQHHVEISYDLALAEPMPPTAYYETVDLLQSPAFSITAEMLSAGNVIARTTTPVRVLPPLGVTLRPELATTADVRHPRIAVQLSNPSKMPRQGTISLKLPAGLLADPFNMAFTLPPESVQTYPFQLRERPSGRQEEYQLEMVDTHFTRRTETIVVQPNDPVHLDHYRRQDGYLFSFGIGEGFVIEALVKEDQGYETRQTRGFAFRPAKRAKTPLRIDGQLADWRGAVPLFLHPQDRLGGLTFFASDYGGTMQWTGLDDFSAAWQMMWDDVFLYLALKTFDDRVIPLGDVGMGDLLTFQIDPNPAATDASIQPLPGNVWRVHTFEVGVEENRPICRRKYATETRPAGRAEGVKIAMQPAPDGIVYEIALPWAELTPLTPETLAWLGFSLVFADDDGFGQEMSCNWFGGNGGNGLAREPRLMGDVHLVSE